MCLAASLMVVVLVLDLAWCCSCCESSLCCVILVQLFVSKSSPCGMWVQVALLQRLHCCHLQVARQVSSLGCKWDPRGGSRIPERPSLQPTAALRDLQLWSGVCLPYWAGRSCTSESANKPSTPLHDETWTSPTLKQRFGNAA